MALNCVANGKMLRDGAFENIWMQPAAGDAGGALGAALAAYYSSLGQPRATPTATRWHGGPISGPTSRKPRSSAADAGGRGFSCSPTTTLIDGTCDALVAEKAVGWFQGRMEFGPRALGARSILGDPRSPDDAEARSISRSSTARVFRPFAPAVLREDVADWFELDGDSPYMLLVADVRRTRRRADDRRGGSAVRHRASSMCRAPKFPP